MSLPRLKDKISIHKNKFFLYTNNERSNIEIKKAQYHLQGYQKHKILGDKSAKGEKHRHAKNHKTSLKEIFKYLNKWRSIPCSWVRDPMLLKFFPNSSVDSL